MAFDAERLWRGESVVEMLHILDREDGRSELVIVFRDGNRGLAEWLRGLAGMMDAARRRMEDPDGD